MNTKQLLIALSVPVFALGASAEEPDIAVSGSGAESAAEVGILPAQKEEMTQKYLMDAQERNPFAKRIKVENTETEVDTQSEEARIRAALETFVVSGIAKGGDGYKVQLGSIILSEGEIIPRLIPGQSDDLRVSKITPERVEITWVADEEADLPRQVSLAVDLTAKVGVLLPTGQASAPAAPAAGAGGQQFVFQSEEDPEEDFDEG